MPAQFATEFDYRGEMRNAKEVGDNLRRTGFGSSIVVPRGTPLPLWSSMPRPADPPAPRRLCALRLLCVKPRLLLTHTFVRAPRTLPDQDSSE